ncbi:CDP-glycerol glycerophosphotransferase family protein [Candidatus Pelagibacter sp.]|nr:CDP-glycerol glycerophosphotransferase family protein [Candidatus Pelagibacter sp.]
MKKIIKFLRSIFSIVTINLLIVFKNIFNNKIKVIFFYFPVKSDQAVIIDFIKDIKSQIDCYVFSGYNLSTEKEIKKLKNSFFLDLGYISFIKNIDIFVSNYVVYKYPKAKNKIYINHDIYDTPMVDIGEDDDLIDTLIKCDYMFLSSDIQISLLQKKISTYVKKNNLPNNTKLINTGYLKLDHVNKKIQNHSNKKDSILIAPTLSTRLKNFNINQDLIKLIETILNNGKLNLIYRPHPADIYNLQLKKNVYKIYDRFKLNKNFFLDTNSSYIESYSRSKFLLTDFSGTAYTYAFSTLKPVIFYSPNDDNLLNTENFKDLSFFKDREKIGKVVKDIDFLKKEIDFIDSNFDKIKNDIFDLRHSRIKHFANSTEQSVLAIKKILEMQKK